MAKLRLQTRAPDFPEDTNIYRSALHESILGTDEVDNETIASEVPVGSDKETCPNCPY